MERICCQLSEDNRCASIANDEDDSIGSYGSFELQSYSTLAVLSAALGVAILPTGETTGVIVEGA